MGLSNESTPTRKLYIFRIVVNCQPALSLLVYPHVYANSFMIIFSSAILELHWSVCYTIYNIYLVVMDVRVYDEWSIIAPRIR